MQTSKVNKKVKQLRTIVAAFKEAGLIISPLHLEEEIEVAKVLEWALKKIETLS